MKSEAGDVRVNEVETRFVEGLGGARLAVHCMGEESARPLVLVHGLFSSAEVNWIKFGNAALLAASGYRLYMPDLRAHGMSAAPHDPEAYPEDVLVEDLQAMISQLGLQDYDLGGFSLGARTVVRGVLAGLAPRKLVLGGMGLSGLSGWARRSAHFIDAIDRFGTIERGDPAFPEAVLDRDYDAPVERAWTIEVAAFDWNCPKHITPRYTEAEVAPTLNRLLSRIHELEAQLELMAATRPLPHAPNER